MNLLAIDTSANLCAAALYDCRSGQMLAKKSEDIGRGHAERLMGLMAETLSTAKLSYNDIDKIAVTCGPGSFTGIRVGLATARGLALGLGVKVIGVSGLEAIAFQYNKCEADTPIVVALDAKRGEVFMQIFSATGEHLSKPAAVSIDQLVEYLPDQPTRIAGSASKVVAAAIAGSSGRQPCKILSNQTAADIADIASLAAVLPITREKPIPLYLRSADAKPQHNFAVERIVD